MDDISRRGFLRGMIAAAALPLVAPLMPPAMISEAVEPVVAHTVMPLESELWIRSGRAPFRLLGYVLDGMIEQEAIESTGLLDEFPNYVPGPVTGRMRLAMDHAGAMVARTALDAGERIGFLIGQESSALRRSTRMAWCMATSDFQ